MNCALVWLIKLLSGVKHVRSCATVLASCFLIAGCDQKTEEPGSVVEEVPVENVAVMDAPDVTVQEPMDEVVFAEATEVVSAATLPGVYADESLPEVRYEIFDDGTWQAVWQPGDPTRGLMMEGVYAVENGELHLRCMTLARREEFLDGDWERRTPPNPRPRGFFKIVGATLVPIPEKTHQAFSMAPFNVSRLKKTASEPAAQ
jgi:hypothetical protein